MRYRFCYGMCSMCRFFRWFRGMAHDEGWCSVRNRRVSDDDECEAFRPRDYGPWPPICVDA